ncbi:fimbrial protein [Vibrio parahaemolyticus]|uniref:fimbrial protein n=1 Tax=Vibrio parahaemolyticus TaxID=670 RepID=UPI00040E52E6|nr:fimbrial protein [Vibrio parahaemolyticus]MBE4469302.1 type 1 fimbrial protein [Vibrio parahaemolyticus]MEA5297871.1 fimbrial protein [Vibrio parahaemolyticus]
MKTLLTASAIALTLSTSAFAAEPVAPVGGTVHFTGFITDTACKVNTQDNPFTENLDLGTFLKTDFAATGDLSQSVPLHLELTDCPDTIKAVTVRVTTTEGESADSAGDYAIKAGGAEGVAIRLTDDAGTAIEFGEESKQYEVAAGVGAVDMNAQYIATKAGSEMKAGHADLDATFSINYK